MSEGPWLTILGLGEDGADGLAPASLCALNSAEIIMGPPRHLSLLPPVQAETRAWPIPFADGIAPLLELRGRRVVVLASGDPFWFGAGTVLARHFDPSEWHALPGPSCFSWAAARLGWALETTPCLGLHAAPLTRLRPHLAPGVRLIVTLRDGQSPSALAAYLCETGFGETTLHIMEALGGPREHHTTVSAQALDLEHTYCAPLCVALEVAGPGGVMSQSAGLDDTWFDHDGQITKRPVRALTLSALAPRPGEHLWDIGGGSGSIAIEWLRAHPRMRATSVEAEPTRAAQIAENAARLGVDYLSVITGRAPEVLEDLDRPDVVFVGGGLTEEMLAVLQTHAKGARLVANAVTLETETLLMTAQARWGGELLRIELANAVPIGTRRGWKARYPIVQWRVTL